MKLENIKPHPNNPRAHDERNIQMVMQSYKDFGEVGAIIVWGINNFIIAGNGRFEAAKRLKLKTLNVIRADHLTAEQAEAFMIADNKTSDSSTFDVKQLTKLLQSMAEADYDLNTTGLVESEYKPLLSPDNIPNPYAEWKDMPEYNNEDKDGCQRIVVHFAKISDVQKFAKLLKQKLTNKTQSIWFPCADIDKVTNERY